MINPEKIRLMTKLELFREEHSVVMREISHKYKTDYVSGKVLLVLIKYSFLFLFTCIIYILLEMDKWIVSFNPELIGNVAKSLFKYYIFVALPTVIISLIYYNNRYSRIDSLRQRYSEGLEELLMMIEDGEK